jgi:hypothetical protein
MKWPAGGKEDSGNRPNLIFSSFIFLELFDLFCAFISGVAGPPLVIIIAPLSSNPTYDPPTLGPDEQP